MERHENGRGKCIHVVTYIQYMCKCTYVSNDLKMVGWGNIRTITYIRYTCKYTYVYNNLKHGRGGSLVAVAWGEAAVFSYD